MENSVEIPQKKLEKKLLYDPAIPLLGIHPPKTKTLIGKDIGTLMFVAALFTIAKTWKQLKCPSADDWIKKIYSISIYGTLLSQEKE